MNPLGGNQHDNGGRTGRPPNPRAPPRRRYPVPLAPRQGEGHGREAHQLLAAQVGSGTTAQITIGNGTRSLTPVTTSTALAARIVSPSSPGAESAHHSLGSPNRPRQRRGLTPITGPQPGEDLPDATFVSKSREFVTLPALVSRNWPQTFIHERMVELLGYLDDMQQCEPHTFITPRGVIRVTRTVILWSGIGGFPADYFKFGVIDAAYPDPGVSAIVGLPFIEWYQRRHDMVVNPGAEQSFYPRQALPSAGWAEYQYSQGHVGDAAISNLEIDFGIAPHNANTAES